MSDSISNQNLPAPNPSGRILSDEVVPSNSKNLPGIRASSSSWSWWWRSIKYLGEDKKVHYINQNSAVKFLQRKGVENARSLNKDQILDKIKVINSVDKFSKIIKDKTAHNVKDYVESFHFGLLDESYINVKNDKNFFIELINKTNDVAYLKHASDALKADKAFIKELAKDHPQILEYASPNLKNDKVFIKELAQSNPDVLIHLSDELKSDYHFIEQLQTQVPQVLQYASKEVLAQIVANKGPDVLSHLPETLKNDYNFIAEIKSKNPGVLKYVSNEMALKFVVADLKNLEHISDDLKNNYKFITQVKSRKPEILKFISRELTLQVAKDSYPNSTHFISDFYFINDDFKKDKEIVLEFLKRDPTVFNLLPDELKTNSKIAKALVEHEGKHLNILSETLKDDPAVVLAAVKKDALALQYASQRLRSDQSFVLQAVKENGTALQFASENLKKDREIVSAAVQSDPDALFYADPSLQNDEKLIQSGIDQQAKQASKLVSHLRGENLNEYLKIVYHNVRPPKADFSLLQGMTSDTTIRYAELAISQFLADVSIGKEPPISPEELYNLQRLQVALFKSKLLAQYMDLNKDPKNIDLNQLIGVIQQQYQQLEIGESILIPAGSVRHAIAYSVTKTGPDTFTFEIMNTDTKNHKTVDVQGAKKYYTKKYPGLSSEQLNPKFWEALLTPYTQQQHEDVVYANIYRHLGDSEDGRLYSAQRMGICADKSIGVWIHTQIVGDSPKSERNKSDELLYKKMRLNTLVHHRENIDLFKYHNHPESSALEGILDQRIVELKKTIST